MKKAPTADQVLDTALDLADFTGWERLHLYVVAARLDVGPRHLLVYLSLHSPACLRPTPVAHRETRRAPG